MDTVRKMCRELHLTLPVIIMTVFPREQLKVETEKPDANGILNKLILQSTLFDALMDAFAKNAPRKDGAQPVFSTKISIYKNHLKGKKMLIAEDNITSQQVIGAILENARISVTIASNGEKAVEEVRSSAFDIVLMDIQMPKLDVYENRSTPTAMQNISEKLLHQLQQTLETIVPLLKKESSNGLIFQQKSSEKHDFTTTLLALRSALEKADPEETQLFTEEIRQNFSDHATLAEPQFRDLEKQIRLYGYGQALLRLEAL